MVTVHTKEITNYNRQTFNNAVCTKPGVKLENKENETPHWVLPYDWLFWQMQIYIISPSEHKMDSLNAFGYYLMVRQEDGRITSERPYNTQPYNHNINTPKQLFHCTINIKQVAQTRPTYPSISHWDETHINNTLGKHTKFSRSTSLKYM